MYKIIYVSSKGDSRSDVIQLQRARTAEPAVLQAGALVPKTRT